MRRGNFAFFAGIALMALIALPAAAGDEAQEEIDLRAKQANWQNQYRTLLTEADRLRAEIDRERELYADANRRTYRRGSKRHVHRAAMQEAESGLAEVEARLATFEDDARVAGAHPGWLRQVELELQDEDRRPVVASGPGDEGRNPLYLQEEEEDN